MKAVVVLFAALFAVASSAGINTYDVCGYDGYYQCTENVVYNYEEPSASATLVTSTDYNWIAPVPWNVNVFGHAISCPVNFDPDQALRCYAADYSAVWAYAAMYPGYYDAASTRYFEVLGAAPNRRALFSWVNNVQYNTNNRKTVQLKIFENGNFEVHVKEYNKLDGDYLLNGLEFVDYTNYDNTNVDFPIYNNNNRNYTHFVQAMYVTAPPTTDVCGNNVVEGNEQCDGGECCTSTCTFTSSSQVCRAASGDCDVAETCSGSSSSCPANEFAPSTQACNEDFGVCNVRLARHCTGSSAECSGFAVPQLGHSPIDWLAYSVVSFGNFVADTGSVGGRLAVKGDVAITGGFSVGGDIVIQEAQPAQTQLITPVDYSFIGGGQVSWVDGELYPAASSSLRAEYGYVGGSFTGSDGLKERMISQGAGNADGAFDNAQAYWTALSDNLALETVNTNVTLYWGGLFFSCLDNSKRYVAEIDASLFAQSTWFSVDGASCPFDSTWIINVDGGDVTFTGGDFPGIGEQVVWNIKGSGRYVTVANTKVNGNILSPQNSYVQTGGVTNGLVIASDILSWTSGSEPSCTDLQPFSFVVPVQQMASIGASSLSVVTFSIANAGDKFSSNGATYTIASRESVDGQDTIVLDRPLEAAISAGTFISFTVDPNQARTNDQVKEVNTSKDNSAVAMMASMFLILSALLF